MAEQIFPTKGNLIKVKRSLKQATLGYELMDRKRSILVREMVALTDEARELRSSIDSTFSEAYTALRSANITLGVVALLADAVPLENSLSLSSRSVMGVELPKVTADITPPAEPSDPTSTARLFASIRLRSLRFVLLSLKTAFIALPLLSKKRKSAATRSRIL